MFRLQEVAGGCRLLQIDDSTQDTREHETLTFLTLNIVIIYLFIHGLLIHDDTHYTHSLIRHHVQCYRIHLLRLTYAVIPFGVVFSTTSTTIFYFSSSIVRCALDEFKTIRRRMPRIKNHEKNQEV